MLMVESRREVYKQLGFNSVVHSEVFIVKQEEREE